MTTLFKISLTIVTISLFSSLTLAQSLTDSLLIHYPFDGNAEDQSGNGYNGIVNATLTQDQFGNSNSAYSFNGTSEFIEFPNVSELKPELPISYSAWVKFNSLPSTGNVIVTNNFAQNNHSGAWLQVSSGGELAIAYGSAIGGTSGNNIRLKRGSTFLEKDIWYHVAGVIRGATDMDLYINCVNDGGTYAGSSNAPIGYTADAGNIGRKDNAGVDPYYFDGEIDEFRYWNRAINLNDIERICDRSASIKDHSVEQNIVVYPNPAENIIHFSGDLNLIEKYCITDLNGREILTSTKVSNVDISNVSKGMYYINFTLKDGTIISEKLMVK